MPADTTLTCRDCGQHFTFTSGEQDFYASRGYSEPSRCPDCRAARKAERDSGGYGSYGGGGGSHSYLLELRQRSAGPVSAQRR